MGWLRMADDNMNDMFEQGRLTLFASWLTQADPEIRAYACLCISNLARTGPSRQRARTATRTSAHAESGESACARRNQTHTAAGSQRAT